MIPHRQVSDNNLPTQFTQNTKTGNIQKYWKSAFSVYQNNETGYFFFVGVSLCDVKNITAGSQTGERRFKKKKKKSLPHRNFSTLIQISERSIIPLRIHPSIPFLHNKYTPCRKGVRFYVLWRYISITPYSGKNVLFCVFSMTQNKVFLAVDHRAGHPA